jgi:hypothetical protein
MRLGSQFKKISMLGQRLHASAVLMKAVLAEIFDESAYLRFLSRRGIASSRVSYAAFLDEHECVKSRRPRCC